MWYLIDQGFSVHCKYNFFLYCFLSHGACFLFQSFTMNSMFSISIYLYSRVRKKKWREEKKSSRLNGNRFGLDLGRSMEKPRYMRINKHDWYIFWNKYWIYFVQKRTKHEFRLKLVVGVTFTFYLLVSFFLHAIWLLLFSLVIENVTTHTMCGFYLVDRSDSAQVATSHIDYIYTHHHTNCRFSFTLVCNITSCFFFHSSIMPIGVSVPWSDVITGQRWQYRLIFHKVLLITVNLSIYLTWCLVLWKINDYLEYVEPSYCKCAAGRIGSFEQLIIIWARILRVKQRQANIQNAKAYRECQK